MKVPRTATALGLMVFTTTGVALAGEPDRRQVAAVTNHEPGDAGQAAFHGEGGEDFDAWLLSEARAVTERLGRNGQNGAAQGAGPMAYQAFEMDEPADEAFSLKSYAGVAMGRVRLGMDIDEMQVRWTKDPRSEPTRVVLGLGYDFTQSLSIGLEYKMLADDKPLFSLNLGGQRVPMNTRFTDHKVDLTLSYRFSL